MSTVGLESLEHSVQLTHIWINELDEKLGWNNKPRAYRLLRTVLHGLRDWLQVTEGANLAAQLPVLLRGVFYEQWRPTHTPVKKRSRAEFLAHVDAAFKRDPLPHTGEAVMAVFELLSKKITSGEISDVRQGLPEEIRALWPQVHAEAGAAHR
jgi:uncharacterized protein (DUF2267 family)